MPLLTRRTVLGSAAGVLASPLWANSSMRVGCQTRAYGSPLTDKSKLLSALENLKSAGYEGFETNYRSLEHSFDNPAPMLREIERRGVPMIGLHFGAGLFDPARIQQEQSQIERIAKAVAAFGGGHLILSGCRLPETSSGRADPQAITAKIRELNRAGKRCQQLGVRLSIHNHQHEVRHNAEELRRLLAGTAPEAVSLLLDVGHIHNNEISVNDFVREYSERINGFHLRDRRGGKEVLMGTGDVDFTALGKVLREAGWSGWFIVEVNDRADKPRNDLVIQAREHIRKTMKV